MSNDNKELEKQVKKNNMLENENELMFEALATYSIFYRKAIDCILDVIHQNKLFMSDCSTNAKSNEELASKLSEVIGTSSEVWINLQRDYDQAIEGDK